MRASSNRPGKFINAPITLATSGPGPPAPPAESPALDPPAEREPGACRLPPDPSLYAARGHYGLRQFEACADAVRSVLAGAERPPAGAHRLLGVALGRLREPRGAIAALRRALEEEGPDPLLLAGLLSAQIQARELPDKLPVRASGALAEASAAAHWLRGQSRLADGEASPAARDFSQASILFTPSNLPGRLAACVCGPLGQPPAGRSPGGRGPGVGPDSARRARGPRRGAVRPRDLGDRHRGRGAGSAGACRGTRPAARAGPPDPARRRLLRRLRSRLHRLDGPAVERSGGST